MKLTMIAECRNSLTQCHPRQRANLKDTDMNIEGDIARTVKLSHIKYENKHLEAKMGRYHVL